MDRNMYFAKETSTGRVGLEKLMQTSLRGIEQKAIKNKKHRFQNLYQLLNSNNLETVWKTINKKAAAGVDKVTAKEFEKNFKENLSDIVAKLKGKKYHAKLVKRVYIPKGKDKTRPLGIPTLSDKLVQSATSKILESIYEQDFIKSSYGYRPKVGAQKAVKDLTKELNFGKYGYIVEADIKGFFNNIDHEWMVRMLKERVEDKALIGLIRKWLKAGILEDNKNVVHPITGTPQGGIISPILANIYLHYALDIWFEKVVKPRCDGEAYICRYADDFVCAFRYKRDAEKFYNVLGNRLNKFNLELAKDKTNMISFSRFRKEENTKFVFLGFEFRWSVSNKGKDIIKRSTSKDKLMKAIENFKQWCKKNRDKRIIRIVKSLNSKLRGYYNYYGVIGNSDRLKEFYTIAMKILYKWLNRRSQRKSFNYKGFKKFIERYKILKPRIVEDANYQLKLEI